MELLDVHRRFSQVGVLIGVAGVGLVHSLIASLTVCQSVLRATTPTLRLVLEPCHGYSLFATCPKRGTSTEARQLSNIEKPRTAAPVRIPPQNIKLTLRSEERR